jgi:hypothetical protein
MRIPLDCMGMSLMRAPRVQYESVQELLGLCIGVLDEYNRQIDMVLLDIWNQNMTKKWSGYDRLMLGIFCFDEAIFSAEEKILQSTKNRGAIFACMVHREICMLLNQSNREYIHSSSVPSRDDLLMALQRVTTNVVLMGYNSLLMRLMRENVCRCVDADRNVWLLCPRGKQHAYVLSLCMSHHERLGGSSLLSVIPCDILRDIVNYLFAWTSWDLHPSDSKVKVGVPV